VKHLSERMGRMSRLNTTSCEAAATGSNNARRQAPLGMDLFSLAIVTGLWGGRARDKEFVKQDPSQYRVSAWVGDGMGW
jgi:hypothetical protein